MLWKLRFFFSPPPPLCGNQTCTLVFLPVISEEIFLTFSPTVSAGGQSSYSTHKQRSMGNWEEGPANEGCSRRYQAKAARGGLKTNDLQFFCCSPSPLLCLHCELNNKGNRSDLWSETLVSLLLPCNKLCQRLFFPNKLIFSVLLFKCFAWKSNKNRRKEVKILSCFMWPLEI